MARESIDTRTIAEDMRLRNCPGVMTASDLMKYTGRSRNWVNRHFGHLGRDGIAMVSAARILGGLRNVK